ncbi:MAG TPA: tripartite tricarboxylate transporter TctB family protein [Pseudolabrys sp.]|jgi:putative tricarboxylic transport membrane protein|nr:tripartite tricarboxylate transporter TctB family protein [Pseudolabrys sp.]
MNETVKETGGAGPSHRGVEIGVAVAMAILALIGIYGSIKVGIGWGAEGPRAGFFPFYVSLAVLISCAVNITKVVLVPGDGSLFAEWGQIRQVLAVVVPTAIYVAAIPFLGIYVASALLIIAFMKWLGKYNWLMSIAVGVVVPILTFLMFEVWFLVPLPKGPLENFLGY